ncbi:hypothetical protein MRX96_005942 [Rhipicephalus microplus]
MTRKRKDKMDMIDRLYRVRPVLQRLNKNFLNAAEMEPCLAVGEMIIPFKGRHSLKIYMMKNPKKWGYKVWTLAGRSGYVYKFELYGDNLVSEPTGLQNTNGESGKIVVRLTKGCAGKEVFCDNFFASAELLAEMKLRGLGCTSTLRSRRTGRCPLQNEKELKGNGRGSFDFRRDKENGLVICQWYDYRTVTIGSNKHSVNPVGSCRRYDRKNKSFVEVQRPSLVRVYNQSMGGVDRADQLLAFYRNDLKTKKWYKRVVFHLLDLAVVNSWLLYRAPKGSSMQLAHYKLQITLGLMKAEQATEDAKEQREFGSTRLSNRASDIPGAVRYEGVNHMPVKISQPNAQRCKMLECKRKTRMQCKKCQVYLCIEIDGPTNCFERFHLV